MKILGHAAGGYLASQLVLKLIKPQENHEKYQVLGAIAGTMPDWDFLWYLYQKKGVAYDSDFRHHTWITHTFPFHWLIALAVYLVGYFKKDRNIKNSAAVLATSSTTHLLQDMVGTGDGIMLFYPFSRKMFGIGLLNVHGSEWNRVYTKSPYYLIELAIIILAAIIAGYPFLKKLITRQK